MKILLVTTWLPYPPDMGTNIRVYNLLKYLARKHSISLISFMPNPDTQAKHLPELEKLCDVIVTVNIDPYRQNKVRKLLGWFSAIPQSFVSTYSSEMQKAIAAHLAARPGYDVVIASVIISAFYLRQVVGVPKVIDLLEVTQFWDDTANSRDFVARIRRCLGLAKFSRFLGQFLPQFALCTVASEEEKISVGRVSKNYSCLAVVPNCLDITDYPLRADPQNNSSCQLIYNGSVTFSANYDAVVFLAEQVMPLVRSQVPSAVLVVTGSTRGVDVENLKKQGVNFTGYLEQIQPVLAEARVCVVPVRSGGGTRLKILEAMAVGVPVVSTTKGCQGLDAIHERHLLIADEPQEFANQVVRLLGDSDLCQSLTVNARELVESKYNWAPVFEKYEQLLALIASGKGCDGYI